MNLSDFHKVKITLGRWAAIAAVPEDHLNNTPAPACYSQWPKDAFHIGQLAMKKIKAYLPEVLRPGSFKDAAMKGHSHLSSDDSIISEQYERFPGKSRH